ncbi:MAG: hypothetical protein ACRED5_18380 [Propylenella sp.]
MRMRLFLPAMVALAITAVAVISYARGAEPAGGASGAVATAAPRS